MNYTGRSLEEGDSGPHRRWLNPLGDDGHFRRLDDIQSEVLENAFIACRGNGSTAARALQVSRSSFYRWFSPRRYSPQEKRDHEGSSSFTPQLRDAKHRQARTGSRFAP